MNFIPGTKMQEAESNLLKHALTAISAQDILGLSKVLSEGLSPNAKTTDGIPLIHLCIQQESPELLALLLKRGADPNLTSPEKVSFILNTQLNPYLRNVYEIKYLSPVMALLQDKNPGFTEYSLFDPINDAEPYPNPALNAKPAMRNVDKKIAMLSLLISYKADINKSEPTFGLTPLHMAVNHSWPALVRKLLDNGADLNKKAFVNYKDESWFKRDFTPIMMAGVEKFKKESAMCVQMLIKAGAKPFTQREDAYVPTVLYKVLSGHDPVLSDELMDVAVKKEGIKLDRINARKVMDEFLRECTRENEKKIINVYVDKMLHTGAQNDTLKNDLSYFAHLNSWVGKLQYDAGNFSMKSVDAEGWEHIVGIPAKLKNLLLSINRISTDKFDCTQRFGEPKHLVLTKLKNEVLNLANSYYTLKHGIMLGEYKLPYGDPRKKQKENLCKMEAVRWCSEINKLKPGETFSIACGNLGHAIYIDYVRQRDNRLSKIIYNLGGGSELHTSNQEGRAYPYVIANLPDEKFKSYDANILDDLSRIILEIGKQHSSMSLRNNIYGTPVKTPKTIIDGGDTREIPGFFAMKPQIAGNCTVKNLNAAMLNRLQNKSLYKYVKNFEKDNILQKVNIPGSVIKDKEIERDLQNFEVMFSYVHRYDAVKCEEELFHFLKKRTAHPQKEYLGAKGDRIVDVIKDLKNPDLIDSYLDHSLSLLRFLEQISRGTKSEKLMELTKEYYKRHTVERREL